MTEMILKIQKPLSTNMPHPEYLIYNQTKSFQYMMGMGSDLDDLFEEGVVKLYIRAEVDATVEPPTVTILELVDQPDW